MDNQTDTNNNISGTPAADQGTSPNMASSMVGLKSSEKEAHKDVHIKVPQETLFQWQAPEFVSTQKPLGWFVGVWMFFAGLIALSIWLQSGYTMIITIVLLVLTPLSTSIWAVRKPKTLIYKITNYGVEVENKQYLYDDFRAFYEYKDYNQPTLDLIPAKRFGTLVSMPLATPDANEIKSTISQMVPIIEHNEDLIDKLFRRLRF